MVNVFWAALGAAIGGGIVALIIEWVRWFVDRPLVRVRASRGLRAEPTSGRLFDTVCLEAVNPHRGSVTLSGVGFTFKGRKAESLAIIAPRPHPLPYELGGGKSLLELMTPEEMIEELQRSGRSPTELEWVWFRSQSGKEYRRKLHENFIQWLEKKYQEL